MSEYQHDCRQQVSAQPHEITLQIEFDPLRPVLQTKLNLPNSPHLIHDLGQTPHLDCFGALAHQTQEDRMRGHMAHTCRGEGSMQRDFQRVDMRDHLDRE